MQDRYIVIERGNDAGEVWRKCNAPENGCQCGEVFHTMMATGTLHHVRVIVDALNAAAPAKAEGE